MMWLLTRSVWPLLFIIVGVCHAYPTNSLDDVHDENEASAWQAGVFRPQPLKPAPWQNPPLPTPQPEAPQAPQAPPAAASSPTEGVHVPGVGEVRGLRGYKVIRNRPIDAFLGIRYAQVSPGLGRFQQSKAAPYQGQIDATRVHPNCPQFPEVQRLQVAEARGENVDDCLTLDIYAPAGGKELPVLVFLHGEMLFDGGSEEAQPDYVLEHDVILVSINYRLAPFGFLSALSEQLPGNVALGDLHLALEWVQHNIGYFGGASTQVTLIGQAAGATLAHALSISPRTEHLFQQLILLSGTALNPYLIDEKPLETLRTFARLAHCPPPVGNFGALYDCLKNQRTSQLAAIIEQLLQQNERLGLSYLGGFKLVVGDPLGYLPEHPAALIANSSKNNKTKPMIVGAAKDASAFIMSRFYDQVQNLQSTNISDYINVVLRHTAPPKHHKIWHDWALKEVFPPNLGAFVNPRSVSQGLLELSNLILYRAPVIDSIRLTYKKSPTYLYTFDYRGEYHRFGHLNNPLPFGVDASLSDDSVYIFPYPEESSNLNPEDKSLARALVAMWVNFAQTGIPNPNADVWPKASSEVGPFLRITNSKQNILELDQHFGEGIYVPVLYPELSDARPAAHATVTTTTLRPIRLGPGRNNDYSAYYARVEEARRQQELKRREQQEKEKQQREELQRQDDDRLLMQRQRVEELQREQQQREQYAREQRQREQEQREQAARAEQDQRERLQREEEQRQNEQRQERERAQQLYEQHLREQQEREQSRQGQGSVPLEPQEREQQERSQEEREQEARELQEQEEQEEQRRAELEREQQERQQQQQQQQRQQQPESTPAEVPDPENYNSYEAYVEAYKKWIEDQQNVHSNASPEQEEEDPAQVERDQRAREQQEQEQQRRDQLAQEQHDREQEQEREQELELEGEREAERQPERQPEQVPEQPNAEGEQQGPGQQEGPDPNNFPTYEDYVNAYNNWIKEQENHRVSPAHEEEPQPEPTMDHGQGPPVEQLPVLTSPEQSDIPFITSFGPEPQFTHVSISPETQSEVVQAEPPNPDNFLVYDDYVAAYNAWLREQEGIANTHEHPDDGRGDSDY